MTGELDDNGDASPTTTDSHGVESTPADDASGGTSAEQGPAGVVGEQGPASEVPAPPTEGPADTGGGKAATEAEISGPGAGARPEPVAGGSTQVEEGAGAAPETAAEPAGAGVARQGEPGEYGPVDAGIEEPAKPTVVESPGSQAGSAPDASPRAEVKGKPVEPAAADGAAELPGPAGPTREVGEEGPVDFTDTAGSAGIEEKAGSAWQAEGAGHADEGEPADTGLAKDAQVPATVPSASDARATDADAAGWYEMREQLARDPARGGEATDKTRREAEVAMNAVEDGQIPGPIQRAPKDADGRDQGDFIDADGQRWDVKSCPDLRPSYARDPGQPILAPKSSQDFTEMIKKDLGEGENVLIDPEAMTAERQAMLRKVTDSNPDWKKRVIWGR